MHQSLCQRQTFTTLFLLLALLLCNTTTFAETKTEDFTLQQGPLTQTLIAISGAFGVDIVGPQELLEDKVSNPIIEAQTIEQALAQALKGSGLTAKPSKSGGYVISESNNEGMGAYGPSLLTSENEQNIEIITVTGTRAGTLLSDLPISVSIVAKEAITKQLRFDTNILRGLEFEIPGLSVQSSTGRTACSNAIRGRRIAFQVNGVPVNDDLRRSKCNGAFAINPFAVEQVESVRGGNALYGAGASGGIVNLITRRAAGESLEIDTTVQTSFASDKPSESFSTDIYVGAGQSFSRFDYYIGAGYRDSGLSRNPDGDLTWSNEFEAITLNGSLGISLDDASEFRVTGTYSDETPNDTAAIDFDDTSSLSTVFILPRNPFLDDASDRFISLIASYTNSEILEHELNASVYYQNQEINQRAGEIFNGETFFFSTNTDSEQLGLRSTLVRSYDIESVYLKTSYGIDYATASFFRPEVDPSTNEEIIGFLAPETIFQTVALFGQAELQSGRWTISSGLRQEWYSGEIGTRGFDPSISTAGQPGDINSANLALFNIGIVYDFTPQIQVYAGFSQGAEITELGRAARRARDPSLISPEPATSDQYELGFRGSSKSLRGEAAIYYSESESASRLQVDPTCEGEPLCPVIPLRAPQEIYGFEGQISWSVTQKFKLAGILTLQNGEIFDENNENPVTLPTDTIIPIRFALQADWETTELISTGIQVSFYGDGTPEDVPDIPENGSYFLMNANISYRIGSGEIYAAASNLLNESYVNLADSGFPFLAEGRRITLGYNARF